MYCLSAEIKVLLTHDECVYIEYSTSVYSVHPETTIVVIPAKLVPGSNREPESTMSLNSLDPAPDQVRGDVRRDDGVVEKHVFLDGR